MLASSSFLSYVHKHQPTETSKWFGGLLKVIYWQLGKKKPYHKKQSNNWINTRGLCLTVLIDCKAKSLTCFTTPSVVPPGLPKDTFIYFFSQLTVFPLNNSFQQTDKVDDISINGEKPNLNKCTAIEEYSFHLHNGCQLQSSVWLVELD